MFILLLLFVSSVRSSAPEFLVQYDGLKYEDARLFCQEWGGDLVTIKNEYQMQELAILEVINIEQSYLIGATDLEQEGTFKWVDGCEVSYNRWSRF